MDTIELTVQHGVGTLTLDAPDRRNALDTAMCSEISEALDDAELRDDVRALVVTGRAPAFCAGADLSQLGQSKTDGLLAIYEGFLRVARSPLPSVAAVNGAAVGAGMNLALACDVRIAARSARFDSRFLKLGIHPGGGHTWMLQRICGSQATAAMVLFGEVLDGEAASEAGLAWRCVDDDRLLEEATTLARRAAEAPADLTRRTVQTIAGTAELDRHQAAVELELQAQVWSMDQPSFAEGLARARPTNGGANKR